MQSIARLLPPAEISAGIQRDRHLIFSTNAAVVLKHSLSFCVPISLVIQKFLTMYMVDRNRKRPRMRISLAASQHDGFRRWSDAQRENADRRAAEALAQAL
jgi:hypothetical protein